MHVAYVELVYIVPDPGKEGSEGAGVEGVLYEGKDGEEEDQRELGLGKRWPIEKVWLNNASAISVPAITIEWLQYVVKVQSLTRVR